MKVDVQYAESHLSDLIAAASRGEVVEIESPIASVHLYASPRPDENGAIEPVAKPASRAGLWGAWEGMFVLPTDDEWAAMDKEIEDEMVNGPIFPPETK